MGGNSTLGPPPRSGVVSGSICGTAPRILRRPACQPPPGTCACLSWADPTLHTPSGRVRTSWRPMLGEVFPQHRCMASGHTRTPLRTMPRGVFLGTGLKFHRLGETMGSSFEHFPWPPPAPKRPAYIHIAAYGLKDGSGRWRGKGMGIGISEVTVSCCRSVSNFEC